MTARILTTGSDGQLGRAIATACAGRGISCRGRDLDTLDIRDRKAVHEWVIAERPTAVVNCAAFTAVDDCESRTEEAMAVNGHAVGHLAEACERIGGLLVQISTDYVFSGDSTRPYRESDPPNPASTYGHSKLLGEEKARAATRHLVVRTAWLFGRGGKNFVEAIRGQIERGAETLQVVADQRGCPTLCDDLAQAVLDLIDVGAEGTVHAVNSGSTTWHGFAIEIARRIGIGVKIDAVTSDRFPRPARRPASSVLDTARLEALLGRSMPTWQDALARYLATS